MSQTGKHKLENPKSHSKPSKRMNDKKCFNDPIHGIIEFHPLLVAVIDTPQFQRLRKIKQLGGNYFVYPGASHNRFEHCIGTCHLAGELARHLQAAQDESTPEKSKITDTDVLCVELAGLCHDLGHGPYSHMFDNSFLSEMEKKRKEQWTHEQGTCDMIDDMFKNEKLKQLAEKEGIGEKELKFIKNMINPNKDEILKFLDPNSAGKWPYPDQEHKKFLYEIVSNPVNGVDVDKWDYFARDCHHLGMQNNFQHRRFMKSMKVLPCEVEGQEENELHLSAREKEWLNLYEMFHARAVLHKKAYQHKVSTAVEMMICEAMMLANDHITFVRNETENGGKRRIEKTISETVNDMKLYVQLNDSIVDKILYSTVEHKNIYKAKEILKRLEERDLYRCIGGKLLFPDTEGEVEKEEIKKEEDKEKQKFENLATTKNLKINRDYEIKKKKFNYGMGEENPVKSYWFYEKDETKGTRRNQKKFSRMLPAQFQEIKLEVYCKVSEKEENGKTKIKDLRECYNEWVGRAE